MCTIFVFKQYFNRPFMNIISLPATTWTKTMSLFCVGRKKPSPGKWEKQIPDDGEWFLRKFQNQKMGVLKISIKFCLYTWILYFTRMCVNLIHNLTIQNVSFYETL